MRNIILASQSPQRKQLLEQAEIEFEIKTAHANEDYPANLAVESVPVFIATNKALAVLDTLNEESDAIIIAADTVVILENTIIGKPTDLAEAKNILKSLSGKTHKVVTGVVIQSKNKTETLQETTEVEFLELTDAQINHYVDKYHPLDKAGAYAIQEWIGLIGIGGINGDFYNVMGLPVNKVLSTLSKF